MRQRGPGDPPPDDWLEGDSWTEEPTEAPASGPGWQRRLRRQPSPPGGRRRGVLALVVAAVLVLAAIGLARAVGGGEEEATTEPTVAAPTATGIETEPSPSPQALPEGTELSLGDSGRQVRRLQRALDELGYDSGPNDGAFGRRTERALRRFQRDVGLEPDGVLGPTTLASLNAALAERS